ncbi:hypothetical protein ACE198_00690 [Neobacillus sp. KR4-4]|nr:hypothetical protein [Bacillus sp. AFS073361]
MNREILQATDEEQMRSFWLEWDKRRTAAESKNEEAGKVKV